MDLKSTSDTMMLRRYKQYIRNNRARLQSIDSLLGANTKKLLDGGVILATGTDAGNIGTQHVSSYFDELSALQRSGFNMWQLVQASTINGAKAVGKESEFGSIKKGKRADLLLLSRNPLDSLSNWESIDWVISKGEAFRPDSLYTTLKPSSFLIRKTWRSTVLKASWRYRARPPCARSMNF
jgi:imidazolonepropionase-like amidohydrolase